MGFELALAPRASPEIWILTLMVSMGWMTDDAAQPEIPPIAKGMIASRVLVSKDKTREEENTLGSHILEMK